MAATIQGFVEMDVEENLGCTCSTIRRFDLGAHVLHNACLSPIIRNEVTLRQFRKGRRYRGYYDSKVIYVEQELQLRVHTSYSERSKIFQLGEHHLQLLVHHILTILQSTQTTI